MRKIKNITVMDVLYTLLIKNYTKFMDNIEKLKDTGLIVEVDDETKNKIMIKTNVNDNTISISYKILMKGYPGDDECDDRHYVCNVSEDIDDEYIEIWAKEVLKNIA